MFVVDCVRRMGGLGLLWGEEVKVEVKNFSHWHVNAYINGPVSDLHWKFTGFCGQPKTPKRHEVWALLPRLCIGDFNEIVNWTKKWGGSVRKRPQMQEFQQTLEECNLVDLGFRGPKYNWSNCLEGRAVIKERLDRGVTNMEWRTWFPTALVSVEATMSSDHAPLVLSLKKMARGKKGNKRLRYEAAWALEDGCKEVIATGWE